MFLGLYGTPPSNFVSHVETFSAYLRNPSDLFFLPEQEYTWGNFGDNSSLFQRGWANLFIPFIFILFSPADSSSPLIAIGFIYFMVLYANSIWLWYAIHTVFYTDSNWIRDALNFSMNQPGTQIYLIWHSLIRLWTLVCIKQLKQLPNKFVATFWSVDSSTMGGVNWESGSETYMECRKLQPDSNLDLGPKTGAAPLNWTCQSWIVHSGKYKVLLC